MVCKSCGALKKHPLKEEEEEEQQQQPSKQKIKEKQRKRNTKTLICWPEIRDIFPNKRQMLFCLPRIFRQVRHSCAPCLALGRNPERKRCHQHAQVYLKWRYWNLFQAIFGGGFSLCRSLIHTAYISEYLHFRYIHEMYLKCLVKVFDILKTLGDTSGCLQGGPYDR